MIWRAAFVGLALCLVSARPSQAQQAGQGAEIAPSVTKVTIPDNPTGRLERILRRQELKVGVKTDYPPWGMISDGSDGEEGTIVGLEPDLAKDLAEALGVKLTLVPVTAKNRLSRVNQGTIDVVIATMGDTVVRRLQADLLEPSYYSSGVVVYGPSALNFTKWSELRDQPICLTQGAYFNRALEENFKIDGRYFPGNREAKLALAFGRCKGWAFDDTALTQQVLREPKPDYKVMEERILVTPWAIAVALGEGQGDLGRFVSAMIGKWHATGRILELERKWGIPASELDLALNAAWSRRVDGAPLCLRDPETLKLPTDCLGPPPFENNSPPIVVPDWAQTLYQWTGVNLSVLYDAYNRGRLIRGLGLTLALSATAIAGALLVGVTLGTLDGMLRRLGWVGLILLIPQKIIVSVARMTPPILQLYIVFFGLGTVMANADLFAPGPFLTAAVILSFYAGSTNAVLLSHALEQEREENPGASVLALLPHAFSRAFDGLVAACVNIVKAAGMASAIALAELISTVNLIVAEGGDARTLMNGLLVFYFLFVLLVIRIFRKLRIWVKEGRHP